MWSNHRELAEEGQGMVWKGWGTPGLHSSPNFAASHTHKISQRITESLRLESPLRSSPTISTATVSIPNPCPQVPHPLCL